MNKISILMKRGGVVCIATRNRTLSFFEAIGTQKPYWEGVSKKGFLNF
jgi:hypothetical protein